MLYWDLIMTFIGYRLSLFRFEYEWYVFLMNMRAEMDYIPFQTLINLWIYMLAFDQYACLLLTVIKYLKKLNKQTL